MNADDGRRTKEIMLMASGALLANSADDSEHFAQLARGLAWGATAIAMDLGDTEFLIWRYDRKGKESH